MLFFCVMVRLSITANALKGFMNAFKFLFSVSKLQGAQTKMKHRTYLLTDRNIKKKSIVPQMIPEIDGLVSCCDRRNITLDLGPSAEGSTLNRHMDFNCEEHLYVYGSSVTCLCRLISVLLRFAVW